MHGLLGHSVRVLTAVAPARSRVPRALYNSSASFVFGTNSRSHGGLGRVVRVVFACAKTRGALVWGISPQSSVVMVLVHADTVARPPVAVVAQGLALLPAGEPAK